MKKCVKTKEKRENSVTSLSLVARYDLLVHVMQEAPLSREKALESVKSLFPSFKEDDQTYVFEEKLGEYVLEMYGYYRSLGMSIAEAAHAAGVTNSLMTKVMEGEGISLDKLIEIAKSELFISAETKGRHLKHLDTSAEKGATIAFLEKIYPEKYTKKGILETTLSTDSNSGKWEVEVTHVETKSKV